MAVLQGFVAVAAAVLLTEEMVAVELTPVVQLQAMEEMDVLIS
jgi:hypothetical protein